jgi:hypothetical protein
MATAFPSEPPILYRNMPFIEGDRVDTNSYVNSVDVDTAPPNRRIG